MKKSSERIINNSLNYDSDEVSSLNFERDKTSNREDNFDWDWIFDKEWMRIKK